MTAHPWRDDAARSHAITGALATLPPQPVPPGWQTVTRGDGSQYMRPLHTTLARGRLGDPALWDGTRICVIEMGEG